MHHLANDIRHAARTLVKARGSSLVVVLTLALGIGATTAVFSLVDSVLIRPLGFAESGRLVALYEGAEGQFDRTPFSPPDLMDVQREQQSFQDIGAYRNLEFEVSGGAEAERVMGAKVSANLFALLGADTLIGRSFVTSEDAPGNDLVVISWELWQRRYSGSPTVLGQSIQLNRRPYTVIGVMPPSFTFPRRGPPANNQPADVWVPIAFTAEETAERGSRFSNSVVARLRAGVTVEEAQTELDVLARRIMEDYPPILRGTAFAERLQLVARPLQQEIAGPVSGALLLLLAAVGLVLLVACSNVANLILSRAAARERDVAIRAALGATRLRLFQRQVIESLLLTLTGGVLGIVFAQWMLSAVPTVIALAIPGLENVMLNLRVLAFSVCVAIATGLAFGILPLIVKGRDLNSLREANARTVPKTHRIQNGLVISTVALAFVLLIGAGLFIRSFAALIATDPGFQSDGTLSASLALPQQGYPTASSVREFHQSLLDRAASLPGVTSAAVATDLPLESYEVRTFTPERAQLEGPVARSALLSWVHGPYFETLGFSLRQGRTFSPDEHIDDRQVVIINESLADRFWPAGDAVGQRLKWGPADSPRPWLTVVGVVSDVSTGPTGMGLDQPIHAYEPFRQFPDFFLDAATSGFGRDVRLIISVQGDANALVNPLRRELTGLDPQLAIARIAEMDELLGETTAPQRFSTTLLTLFAASALSLVAIGLSGLMAFAAEQRRREMGVRIALGARPTTLVQMMLAQGVRLVCTGIAIGLVASLSGVRWLSSFLYGTNAYDPMTFVAVLAVVLMVGLLASALPAYRAARVDPMRILRQE